MKKRLYVGNKYYGWLYIAPAFLLVMLLIGYPLVKTIDMSFRDYVLTKPADGFSYNHFQNYIKLASDSDLLHVILNTIVFVIAGTGLSFLIGLGLALMVNRLSSGWKRFFSSYFLIPYIIPSIVLTLLWMWIFNPSYGIANYLLSNAGVIAAGIPWFTDAVRGPLAILLLYIYKSAPFHMMMIFAALQTVNLSLYEAVDIDGGSARHKFIYVTAPSIRAVIVTLLSLSAMHCMNFFSPIWLLSQGGPGVSSAPISVYLYTAAFKRYDFGYASSLSVVWMALVGILSGSALIFKSHKGRKRTKKESCHEAE